jgi:hypothetical protein
MCGVDGAHAVTIGTCAPYGVTSRQDALPAVYRSRRQEPTRVFAPMPVVSVIIAALQKHVGFLTPHAYL